LKFAVPNEAGNPLREPSDVRNRELETLKFVEKDNPEGTRVAESLFESAVESRRARESQSVDVRNACCGAHTPSLMAGCLIGVKPNARGPRIEALRDNPKRE
jgi:hypothetical protein